MQSAEVTPFHFDRANACTIDTMTFPFNPRSLPVQMIAAFFAVVLLTAATVGVPAIWLLQTQLERQAWSQVEQGQRAAISLYDAQKRDLENLSILTAQRPSLYDLLQQGDRDALAGYLHTLQRGAGLDLIEICAGEQTIASTMPDLAACQFWPSDGYYIVGDSPTGQVWLVAHAEANPNENQATSIVVGIQLDDEFAALISDETGLEHTIWHGQTAIATSFSSGAAQLQSFHPTANAEMRYTFEINGVSYNAAQISLAEDGLRAEVALDVAALHTTQSNLAAMLVAGIAGVSLAGSVLGAFLARRISRPLVRLSLAATTFSHGDLQTPVSLGTHVREVAQVARALENARVDLLATLTSLEEEKAWVDHLLASIVEGIVTLDGEGRITFFSHGAERIMGWSRAEVLGRLCDEVFRPAERELPFQRLIPAPGKRVKLNLFLAGGREATLAITGAELTPSEAREAEVALVFRDISEEEAIHRILGHFLANVAHEFRTPLSALAASIELLLDQATDLSPVELHELLVSLHLGTLGLQTLVDNLLESASIEAGRFHISPRPADLGNIVAEAAETMQPLLAKYEQQLIVELPVDIPVVQADPRRTVQVLVNLLGNASKYGPPGAEIQLKVSATPRAARLSVADQGPGIPAAARADLFRRFVFPEMGSINSQAGAGLGLSVVKAIVEAHGGEVGVEDRPGGGSLFWFTLPLANPETV